MLDQPLAIAAAAALVLCYVALRVTALPRGRAVTGLTCLFLSLLTPALADSLSSTLGVRLGIAVAFTLLGAAWLETALPSEDRTSERRSTTLPLLFIAFCAAGVVSTWFNAGSLPLQVAIVVAAWGILVRLAPTPIQTKDALTRTLTSFTWLICALLPTGLLDQSSWISELGTDVGARSPLNELLGLPGRWSGPFPHPNTLGFFAALAIVHAVTLSRVPRLVLGIPAALLLVLSGSYTSAAAALAGALVVMVLRRTDKLGRAWTVLLIGGAAAAFITLSANASFTGRTSFWGVFLERAAERPVLGWGAQGADRLIGLGVLPGFAVNAHNWMINTLFVGGLVGLTLGLVALVRLTLGASRADKADRPAAVALLVVLAMESVTESGLVATSPSLAWLCVMAVWLLAEPTIVPTRTVAAPASSSSAQGHRRSAATRQ